MKPLTKRTLALPAVAAVVASTLSIGAPAAATERVFTPSCVDDPTALGVEEALVYEPAPRELLAESGLDRVAADFAAELCSLTGTDGLSALVEERARGLWQKGILAARAMGADGELDADDRPLYWARLAMTGALRQWSAANDVPQKTLEAELAKLDALSRGQDTLDPDASKRDVVVLTGFDPFFLNRDARISNPSGAIVLALDGEIVQGPNGPVEIQAALFPVRWRDFGDGMVEKALTPAFSAKNRPQLFFTISQGSPKSFDLEAFNGAWRGGTVDNEQVCSQGTTPIPAGVATVSPQPQWTESTLPRQAMADDVDGQPFAVNDRRSVVELPAGTPSIAARQGCPADRSLNEGTKREDGPSEGSVARAGGGGTYLSNEIAYRATLLRDALGEDDLPGGHVHTPVLEGVQNTASEVSNPEFVRNRQQIIAQTKSLLESALAHGTAGNDEPTETSTETPTETPTEDPSDEPTTGSDTSASANGTDDGADSGRDGTAAGSSDSAGAGDDGTAENGTAENTTSDSANSSDSADEAGRLPRTGGLPLSTAAFGALLIAAGAALVIGVRRRRSR